MNPGILQPTIQRLNGLDRDSVPDLPPPLHSASTEVGWHGVRLSVLLAVLAFVLDRTSKAWVLSAFQLGQTLPLWPNILHLTYVYNTGAAFSMLSEHTTILLPISALMIAMLIGFLVWAAYRQLPMPRLWWGAFGSVVGGALGNAVDRWWFGHVIDFIDVRGIHYPIFNVADSFICLGVLGLLVDYAWRSHRTAR